MTVHVYVCQGPGAYVTTIPLAGNVAIGKHAKAQGGPVGKGLRFQKVRADHDSDSCWLAMPLSGGCRRVGRLTVPGVSWRVRRACVDDADDTEQRRGHGATGAWMRDCRARLPWLWCARVWLCSFDGSGSSVCVARCRADAAEHVLVHTTAFTNSFSKAVQLDG